MAVGPAGTRGQSLSVGLNLDGTAGMVTAADPLNISVANTGGLGGAEVWITVDVCNGSIDQLTMADVNGTAIAPINATAADPLLVLVSSNLTAVLAVRLPLPSNGTVVRLGLAPAAAGRPISVVVAATAEPPSASAVVAADAAVAVLDTSLTGVLLEWSAATSETTGGALQYKVYALDAAAAANQSVALRSICGAAVYGTEVADLSVGESTVAPQVHVTGLAEGVAYNFVVVASTPLLRSRPLVYAPATATPWFEECPLVSGLPFCDMISYSANVTSVNGLLSDAEAADLYAAFEAVMAQTDCRYRYSVWTCDDCRDAYKRWLCAESIARCSEDGGGGVLPVCRDRCWDVVQRCPVYFGFTCQDASVVPIPEGTVCNNVTSLGEDAGISLAAPMWLVAAAAAVASVVIATVW